MSPSSKQCAATKQSRGRTGDDKRVSKYTYSRFSTKDVLSRQSEGREAAHTSLPNKATHIAARRSAPGHLLQHQGASLDSESTPANNSRPPSSKRSKKHGSAKSHRGRIKQEPRSDGTGTEAISRRCPPPTPDCGESLEPEVGPSTQREGVK